MRTSANGPGALSAALLVAATLLIAACGASGTATASSGCTTVTTNVSASKAGASGSWQYSNADLANTRYAAGSTISTANVSRLAQAWTFKLTGKAAVGVRPYGSLSANPIVQNGVVYLQDLDSNVFSAKVRAPPASSHRWSTAGITWQANTARRPAAGYCLR